MAAPRDAIAPRSRGKRREQTDDPGHAVERLGGSDGVVGENQKAAAALLRDVSLSRAWAPDSPS